MPGQGGSFGGGGGGSTGWGGGGSSGGGSSGGGSSGGPTLLTGTGTPQQQGSIIGSAIASFIESARRFSRQSQANQEEGPIYRGVSSSIENARRSFVGPSSKPGGSQQLTPTQSEYLRQREKVTKENPNDPMGYFKDVAYQQGKPAMNLESMKGTGYANMTFKDASGKQVSWRDQTIDWIAGQYMTPEQIMRISPGGLVRNPITRDSEYRGGSESVFPTNNQIIPSKETLEIMETAIGISQGIGLDLLRMKIMRDATGISQGIGLNLIKYGNWMKTTTTKSSLDVISETISESDIILNAWGWNYKNINTLGGKTAVFVAIGLEDMMSSIKGLIEVTTPLGSFSEAVRETKGFRENMNLQTSLNVGVYPAYYTWTHPGEVSTGVSMLLGTTMPVRMALKSMASWGLTMTATGEGFKVITGQPAFSNMKEMSVEFWAGGTSGLMATFVGSQMGSAFKIVPRGDIIGTVGELGKRMGAGAVTLGSASGVYTSSEQMLFKMQPNYREIGGSMLIGMGLGVAFAGASYGYERAFKSGLLPVGSLERNEIWQTSYATGEPVTTQRVWSGLSFQWGNKVSAIGIETGSAAGGRITRFSFFKGIPKIETEGFVNFNPLEMKPVDYSLYETKMLKGPMEEYRMKIDVRMGGEMWTMPKIRQAEILHAAGNEKMLGYMYAMEGHWTEMYELERAIGEKSYTFAQTKPASTVKEVLGSIELFQKEGATDIIYNTLKSERSGLILFGSAEQKLMMGGKMWVSPHDIDIKALNPEDLANKLVKSLKPIYGKDIRISAESTSLVEIRASSSGEFVHAFDIHSIYGYGEELRPGLYVGWGKFEQAPQLTREGFFVDTLENQAIRKGVSSLTPREAGFLPDAHRLKDIGHLLNIGEFKGKGDLVAQFKRLVPEPILKEWGTGKGTFVKMGNLYVTPSVSPLSRIGAILSEIGSSSSGRRSTNSLLSSLSSDIFKSSDSSIASSVSKSFFSSISRDSASTSGSASASLSYLLSGSSASSSISRSLLRSLSSASSSYSQSRSSLSSSASSSLSSLSSSSSSSSSSSLSSLLGSGKSPPIKLDFPGTFFTKNLFKEKIFSSKKFKYTPSLAASMEGIFSSKMPKSTISGLNLRPVVKRRKS
ncbi:MAG: hypothetical protein NT130_03470 [Candidatus Micrarchaeota archaeon]|nr:hypothetical protein [Candidatus Micrarchaeota archaeon]